MSGIEPLLLASLAGIGEAAAGVGTAIGSAVGGAGAASAGELALISSAANAAGVAVPGATSGLSLAGATSAAGTLASAAGAGAQLLAEPPKIDLPQAPIRDTAKQEADARSAQLKRRGRAATLLTGAGGVTSNPTLGSPALTGTA